MRFQLCQTAFFFTFIPFAPHGTHYVACDKHPICRTWFSQDCAMTTCVGDSSLCWEVIFSSQCREAIARNLELCLSVSLFFVLLHYSMMLLVVESWHWSCDVQMMWSRWEKEINSVKCFSELTLWTGIKPWNAFECNMLVGFVCFSSSINILLKVQLETHHSFWSFSWSVLDSVFYECSPEEIV